MLANLRALVLGNVLSLSSKALLTEWLTQNQTGNEPLRASLPAAWKVGDKTGEGERGTTNDLAIIWPPQRSPVLVTIYLTGAKVGSAGRIGILAAIGRSIASMGS